MTASTLPDVGIERIGVWPCTLALPMSDLCAARGHDLADLRETMMIDERGLNPPWEDPVTMAVNAGNLILTEDDRDRIELLIVASESGVDQEKSLSTWVQRYLGLTRHCRNIEVKHACYGGTAGLQLAASWLASGLSRGAKALVIGTDQSRMHLGKPWEFVMGAGAAAVLVSDQPDIARLELGRNGYWTNEVSDLTRPTSTVETGNSETSLISYLDALEGAFDHYRSRVPEAADYDGHFQRHIYHTPFGGMAYRAHRTMLRLYTDLPGKAATENFRRKSQSALAYLRRMGGTYSSSTFIGLLGMIANDDGLATDDRISMFSYGSGSCAEFYSVLLGAKARPAAAAAGLPALLDARRPVTVAQYEAAETFRTEFVDAGDYVVDRDSIPGHYDSHYRGRHRLVFTGMKEYYRQYAWA
jgi:3-hydroxy-3-methylglutaryl CoA synthase